MSEAPVGGRSLRAAVWAIAVQGLDLVAQIAVSVLVGRLLGVDAMGRFTFAFAVVAIAGLFLLFGAHAVLVQHYTLGRVDAGALLGASLLVLRRGAAICLVICLGVGLVSGLRGEAALVMALAYLAMLSNGLAQVVGIPLLARDASARDLPCMAVARLVMLGAVTAAAMAGSLPGVVCGYIVGALTLAGARAYMLHRHVFPLRVRFDPAVTKLIRGDSRAIGVANFGAEISARADILMLEWMTTTTQVGFYGAAYRIVNGIYAGTCALGNALFPGLVHALETGEMTKTAKLYAITPWAILAGCAVLAFFFADILIAILYGDAFDASSALLTMLLLAAGLMAIAYFLSNYLVATGRQAALPRGELSSMALNVGLNLWLIPTHGAWGAALATLATQFLKLGVFAWALTGPAVVTNETAP